VDYLLSAYSVCPAIDAHVEAFFNSSDFKEKEVATADVRSQLGTPPPPFLPPSLAFLIPSLPFSLPPPFPGTLLNMTHQLVDMPLMYDRVTLATKYGDVPSGGA